MLQHEAARSIGALNGTAIADHGFNARASASPATYGANGEISLSARPIRPSPPILGWRDASLKGAMSDFPFSPPPPPRFRLNLRHWWVIAVLVAAVLALGALLVSAA